VTLLEGDLDQSSMGNHVDSGNEGGRFKSALNPPGCSAMSSSFDSARRGSTQGGNGLGVIVKMNNTVATAIITAVRV